VRYRLWGTHPVVASPKTGGFGSVLIERSITRPLGGEIEHEWRQNGLRLKIAIPLDRLAV